MQIHKSGKGMITENDKRKIAEFVNATNWSNLDWNNQAEINDLLDILKAFNNDPKLAVRYWTDADKKSNEAIKQYYLDTVQAMGLSTEQPISKAVMLNYFQGNQKAVDHFFDQLKADGKALAQKVFKTNFTDVVAQMLIERHTVQ